MLTVPSHDCCLTLIHSYRQHYDANPIDSDSEMGDAFRAGNNAADIMMEIRASRGWQITEDMMMEITEGINDRKNAEHSTALENTVSTVPRHSERDSENPPS